MFNVCEGNSLTLGYIHECLQVQYSGKYLPSSLGGGIYACGEGSLLLLLIFEVLVLSC